MIIMVIRHLTSSPPAQSEEILSALGPFHCSCFTSVLAMVCLLWVLGLCLVCVFLVWLFACVVVSLVFACAPYAPSYISYEDSSHSEMGT